MGASTTRVRGALRPHVLQVPALCAAALLVTAHAVPAAAAGAAGAPTAAGTHGRNWGRGLSLVSATASGGAASGVSGSPAISEDGRYVAFVSTAADLVPGDTNDDADIFVRDLKSGRTARVSVDSEGRQANRESALPALSRDGRYVAFESWASNLVPGDTNAFLDAFVHDLRTGVTKRVSLGVGGVQADEGGGRPLLSENGRYVAFYSTAHNLVPGPQHFYQDAYLRDLGDGDVRRISVGYDGALAEGFSTPFGISDDGRRVVFESAADNLVRGDSNDTLDVFVYDARTRRTTRVSVGTRGREADSYSLGGRISGDGRYAAFGSAATNLVPGDTNEETDVFVHDLRTGRTARASVADSGAQLDGSSLLVDLSDEGDEVAFDSFATNAVPGDTNNAYDVFVRDTDDATTTRVSLAADGSEPDGGSVRPAISGDGRRVAFESGAGNLVADDGNGLRDVFVRTLGKGR
jgi:Tol biopolymer transport system component